MSHKLNLLNRVSSGPKDFPDSYIYNMVYPWLSDGKIIKHRSGETSAQQYPATESRPSVSFHI